MLFSCENDITLITYYSHYLLLSLPITLITQIEQREAPHVGPFGNLELGAFAGAVAGIYVDADEDGGRAGVAGLQLMGSLYARAPHGRGSGHGLLYPQRATAPAQRGRRWRDLRRAVFQREPGAAGGVSAALCPRPAPGDGREIRGQIPLLSHGIGSSGIIMSNESNK